MTYRNESRRKKVSETKIYEARRGTKAFLLRLLKLFRTKMFNHNVEGKSTSAILRKSILGVSHNYKSESNKESKCRDST